MRRIRVVAILGLLACAAWALDTVWSNAVLANAQQRYGSAAHARVLAWLNLMAHAHSATEFEKLQQVNAFFNLLPNLDDFTLWEREDYWANPLELLGRNGGDCEDFAIAKYFALRELGVEDDRLRLVYVKAYIPKLRRVEPHMVLAYHAQPGIEPLLLDNLNDRILTASQRRDLAFTYSFPADQIWNAKMRSSGRLDGGVQRSMLHDLRAQMAAADSRAARGQER